MFKAGDVVQLKSGGPRMTVERVPGDVVPEHHLNMTLGADSYLCMWFDESCELIRDYFREVSLSALS